MNHHTPPYTPPDQLSIDELRAYRDKQLTGPAQHRVERLLLENPFYADALAGLDALQQAGGSLQMQTQVLREALQVRLRERATPRRLMPLWVATLVASILLVIAVAIYLIVSATRVVPPAGKQHTIEPGTILLDIKDLGDSTLPVSQGGSQVRPRQADTVQK